MKITVPLFLLGWPLVAILLFAFLSPRRAAITGFLGAWLFLPVADFPLLGLPDYSKVTSAWLGVLLGALFFDRECFLRLRPRWWDLPMAVWCVCPLLSSLSNDLGWYDGCAESWKHVNHWGMPYLIGRLYFGSVEGLRELAQGVFIGGLIYVPLCLLEVRLSPQLHAWVYGFHPQSFMESRRFGGWRPVVFLQHGLAVGLWMAAATLSGAWLWWTGALGSGARVRAGGAVLVLLVTLVLCKSAGSVLLLAAGTGVLLATRWTRVRAFVLILVAAPVLYMAVRGTGLWEGKEAARLSGELSPERALSLEYRLEAENGLAKHALKQPIFGWGGWGRNRPHRFDSEVRDMATDGLWIITLGTNGIVGLASLTLVLLLPPLLLALRLPPGKWSLPGAAPLSALAVILVLYMIDNLANAMLNPVYLLAAAGLGALAGAPLRPRSSPSTAAAPSAPRAMSAFPAGGRARQEQAP